MNFKIFKVLISIVFICGLCFLNSPLFAETPEEFCGRLPQIGVTDPCKSCGEKCAVVITNVGNKECYECPGVGACKLDVTCKSCEPDYPACVE